MLIARRAALAASATPWAALAQPGPQTHRANLLEVTSPTERLGRSDHCKLGGAVAAETEVRPVPEGDCPLVRR